MDTGAEINLSLVTQQVNYQRKFLSPEKVQITIPTFPFQAFDMYSPGYKIKPWSIVDMLISTRWFANWPAKHTDRPEESNVDTHILLKDNLIVFMGLKLNIAKEFYQINNPKFPLVCDVEVINAGRSSTRRLHTLRHQSMTSPYVKCEMDDVLIDKVTRRPTPFPDWWNAKFSYIDSSPKQKFEVCGRPTDLNVIENSSKVEFEHLDHNKHTTTSAYLEFCFNAIFENIKHGKYNQITASHFDAGVKSLVMLFYEESLHSDMLTLESWESDVNVNQVYFNIRKQNKIACYIAVEFYPNPNTMSSKM